MPEAHPPGIGFKKIWCDDDILEFEISTSDESSTFVNEVYVGISEFEQLVESLEAFRRHGGIHDLQLGRFGPEFASGAFHARLHFFQTGRGHLYISITAEGEWRVFTVAKVANRATFHLVSEPGLFDNFVLALRAIQADTADHAFLEAVDV